MTAEDAFLEDIRENPDDDGVRLIYADWLEDRADPGDSDRAEFIRLQIALDAQTVADPLERIQRARDLLERHWDDWTGPLWHILGHKTLSSAAPVRFRRGFLHELTLNTAEFLTHHRALLRVGPIGKLRLLEAGGHGVELCACESLSSLRELEFADYFREPFTGPDMMALAISPHLTRLRVLRLARNNLGDAGLYALAGAGWLSKVVALDLTDNGLSHDGVMALARTRRFFRPLWLRLARNPIGNPTSVEVVRPDILVDVTRLDIAHCNLDNRAVAVLASLPLEALRELDLSGNDFDDEGARALVRAPWMPRLRRLSLRNNALTHRGLGLLAPLLSLVQVEL